MTRRINYEDDIFTIALQVRCLQDTLKLEVDADLFRDRVLGDIQWIDSVTARLYRHATDPKTFRSWLDYADTYLAVWVVGYEQGQPLCDEMIDPPQPAEVRKP